MVERIVPAEYHDDCDHDVKNRNGDRSQDPLGRPGIFGRKVRDGGRCPGSDAWIIP
jgi:hypothetical protein